MNAQTYVQPAVYADASLRTTFIRCTYNHMAGLHRAESDTTASARGGGPRWRHARRLFVADCFGCLLIVLAAFIGVSWLGEKWAQSNRSPQMKCTRLGLFAVAEAVIFLPLLYIAAYFSSPDVSPVTAGDTPIMQANPTVPRRPFHRRASV